jgi:hypothetical protein
MKKPRYEQGSLFAVPLPSGGFAIGLIARASRSGQLLGYFFGPRRTEVPGLELLEGLAESDAVLVAKVGHLGVKQGSWPLIGRLTSWRAGDWPMPVFVRHEELTGRSFMVFYDDQDPGRLKGERQIASGEVFEGPEDGLMGVGFAEGRLDRLLA